MTDPRRAGDFLRDIVKQAGRRRTRCDLNAALDQVLPPAQRCHCEVVGFRGGKLTLAVASAPLFAELSAFARDELRRRINELVAEPVAQVQFRLGGTAHV